MSHTPATKHHWQPLRGHPKCLVEIEASGVLFSLVFQIPCDEVFGPFFTRSAFKESKLIPPLYDWRILEDYGLVFFKNGYKGYPCGGLLLQWLLGISLLGSQYLPEI